MLSVELLGAFRLRRGGRDIKVSSAKQIALLTYLACEGPARQPRERLLDLLWGRSFETQARQSLRQAISKLRATVGFELIVVEGTEIGLAETGWTSDYSEFIRLKARNTPGSLAKMVDLWRGDLLSGLPINEPSFETWLDGGRRRVRESLVDALHDLAEHSLQCGSIDRALSFARRGSAVEPFRDDLCRLVMTSFHRLGRRAEALRWFAEHQKLLKAELGTAPDDETMRLAETFRSSGANTTAVRREDQVGELDAGARPSRDHQTSTSGTRPSIAVLPFKNISSNQGEQFFADGITEDLITALSRFRWLTTISRNSSFSFRDQTVSTTEIGRQLNAGYLLEGSVRKAGTRIRVTAHLVDLLTNAQLWTERYDGELKDIFDLQDDITQRVAASLTPELEKAEWQRAQTSSSSNLNAWQMHIRGMWHFYKHSAKDLREASIWLQNAIDSDNSFGRAYAALAYVKFYKVTDGYSESPERELHEALKLAEKAVVLDDQDAFAHFVLGRVNSIQFKYERAISALEFAVRLNPSLADAYHALGFTYTYGGQPRKAIPLLEMAYALSPHDANVWAFFGIRAAAYIELQEYDKAIDCGREAVQKRHAKYWAYSHLASALGHGGAKEEARKIVEELLLHNPKFSVEFAREHLYYYREKSSLEHYLEGLRKAGLREDHNQSQ